MRACICDVCGKVQPMEHYGIPTNWIYIEQRVKQLGLEVSGNDEEDFPKAEFEASCCSWSCVEALARLKQKNKEQP